MKLIPFSDKAVGLLLARRVLSGIGCTLVTGAALLLSHAALGDMTVIGTVKVVQTAPTTDTTDQSQETGTRQVTLVCRGNKARTDIDGVQTAIFDGGTVYVLDESTKTYYKVPLKSWTGDVAPVLTRAVAANVATDLNVHTKLNFDTTDNLPGNYQSLAGFQARKFLLSGWINVTQKRSGGGSGGFGRGGRGGGGIFGIPLDFESTAGASGWMRTVQFGGGYGGHRQRQGMSAMLSSTSLSGELWSTKSEAYTSDKSNSEWASALVSSWGVGQLLQSLTKAILNSHELPLLAKIEFSWTLHQRQPGADNGDTEDSSGDIQTNSQNSVTTTVTVNSVSEAPVDPTLLSIPSDYTQISAPAPGTTQLTRWQGLGETPEPGVQID